MSRPAWVCCAGASPAFLKTQLSARVVNRWCIRSRADPPATPSAVQHAPEKWRKEAFDFRPREFRVGEPTLASRRANAGRCWTMRQLETRVLSEAPAGRRAP